MPKCEHCGNIEESTRSRKLECEHTKDVCYECAQELVYCWKNDDGWQYVIQEDRD